MPRITYTPTTRFTRPNGTIDTDLAARTGRVLQARVTKNALREILKAFFKPQIARRPAAGSRKAT